MKLSERALIVAQNADGVLSARRAYNRQRDARESMLPTDYFKAALDAAERVVDGSEDPEDLGLVLGYDLVEATGSPNEEEIACAAHLEAIKAWRKDMSSEANRNHVLATREALRSVLSMGSVIDQKARQYSEAVHIALAEANAE